MSWAKQLRKQQQTSQLGSNPHKPTSLPTVSPQPILETVTQTAAVQSPVVQQQVQQHVQSTFTSNSSPPPSSTLPSSLPSPNQSPLLSRVNSIPSSNATPITTATASTPIKEAFVPPTTTTTNVQSPILFKQDSINVLKQPTTLSTPSSHTSTTTTTTTTTKSTTPPNSSPTYKPLSTNSYPSRTPYIPTKVQEKKLTGDMFSGVDFSTIKIVEELTMKTINDQVGAEGIRFEPAPFNSLFLNAQIQLSQLEKNVDAKLDRLVDECNSYGMEYKNHLQELLITYQETFQHFSKLEKGVNTIGAGAIHFGDELDSVTQQKIKAQSALSLINYLLELNNPESDQRSDIFTNSERIHELANLVKKLSSVSEDLKEISILNKGKSETESLSNTLENDLINQFERAQERGDLEKMRQCASTLHNFNGGMRCRSRYIQKLKMFFDIESLRRDEHVARDVAKRSIRGNNIQDERFKKFYAEILKDVAHEQHIIQTVFVNQTSAMGMLITRIFEQRVRSFIETVLGMENDNVLFLTTLFYAFQSTKTLLVDPLAQYGISGVDFGNLISSIFCSYQDGYISRELSALQGKLNELLNEERENVKMLIKNNEFDEGGLNPEFTQSFIQQTENALTRCLLLSPELQVADNIKSIFFFLLHGLCTDYIEATLDRVMKLSLPTSDKCFPSLSQLFKVVLSVNQVVGQLQSLYQLYVLPPIQANIIIQSKCSEQLYYHISRMEDKINYALEQSLLTMVAIVDKVLLDQKRNDYMSDDYDASITTTCKNVVSTIQQLFDLSNLCLQGKNFSIFIEEFGLKLNVILLNHYKKFKISQGSFKLMSDLSKYREIFKQFRSHKVDESFDVLFELSKLHMVNAENFKSVIEGGPLSRMSKADIQIYIKQRSDFKSIWLDML
ncbi:exocyst complex subunit 5 [Cavenderia fasciculata]|uniref:Exocyst complex subunit 5 n=1 Tax=Cavenderia fasciculata TaxID=261658 RepID=F4QC79_CACFS|nr:exocyst complex subunit 5 [Cavenderia fasciculata]EGG14360.1 exocyst complex subunit 5 [Cavenderia fasciculata]|eukprot:XP_004351083.1 exocyst complex subunit 5 [Cavenderia fasciculata]